LSLGLCRPFASLSALLPLMKVVVTFHHTVKKDSRFPVPRKTAIVVFTVEGCVWEWTPEQTPEFALTKTKLLASVLVANSKICY
jgi:hypothetical protein